MDPDSFPFAASRGDVNLVSTLIVLGNDVNAVDPDGATGLHLAISSGRSSAAISEIISVLLEAGASLDARNNEGYTPLHVAAANGHADSVDLLIGAGANVNAEIDAGGVTSLFLAIKHDQADNDRTEVIRSLIQAGASLEQQDANGFSPLRKAVALGKVSVVRQLIASGADVNEVNNARKSILLAAARSLRNDEDISQIIQMLLEAGALPNVPDSRGFTPLHAAATLGKARRVDQLIRAGADVNAIDESIHRTILHSVIFHVKSDEDRFEVVRLLLEAGISFDLRNERDYDALQFAAASRRVNTVEQLVLAGANVNSRSPDLGESCLHSVANWKGGDDYSAAVRSILNAGGEINSRDRMQRTPLHNAARSGNLQIFKQLIEAGADVHAQDRYGNTILSIAISPSMPDRVKCNDLLEIVRTLLRAGVPVENFTNQGKPLLHYPIARGYIEIVEELISAGIDVQAVEENGYTCLHVAVLNAEEYISNCSQIVRVLSNAGAPVNGCDEKQRTPLHIAVSKGYAEWVESLIEAGADANAKNSCGESSMHLAIKLEKSDERLRIIRSLTEAGVSVVERATHSFMYDTPLEFALENGNLSVVELKYLVQAYVNEHPNPEISRRLELIGADEDTISYRLEVISLLLMTHVVLHERFTPLHYAVITGDVTLVEHLIREGVDVNAATYRQETSLHLALRTDLEVTVRHQIVPLLLRANAFVDVPDRHGNRPLRHALRLNDDEMVRQLITAGADARFIDDSGFSYLHDALCNKGHRDPSGVITILINAGAPVNVIDNRHKRTPLHYAVLWGHVEAVEQLIRAGVDVNVADHESNTCLHWAAEAEGYSHYLRHGTFEIDHSTHTIIKLLLEAGANPDVRKEHGTTPLFYAAHVGDPKFVELLIDAGADVNAITIDGCSALVRMCKDRSFSVLKDSTARVVKLLTENGAEVIHPDDESSPRHLVLNGVPGVAYDYYLRCQRELQMMRESAAHGSVTYHQILKRKGEISYMRNQCIIEEFERGDYMRFFPIFGQDLKKSFLATQARRDLMGRASVKLHHIIGFSHEFIHDQILDYLDDEDLKNLSLV